MAEVPPGDCCDTDSDAFPGQFLYFSVPTNCGGYDYNCNSSIEMFTSMTNGSCVGSPISACGGSGSCGLGNDGNCQTRVTGWRVDWKDAACAFSGSECGKCSPYWVGPTMGQSITECLSCNQWSTLTQICH